MIRVCSLVCSCSGKNGATAKFSDMLAEELSRRAEQIGETVDYERITADTVDVKFCRSCNNCFCNGVCPLDSEDDVGELKKKILSSDILFFCSPVYMGGMSGFAKCLIDRFAYLSHRFELAGKTAAILVTTSANYGNETVGQMKKIFQFEGASVAYAGCAYRHQGKPNIHLPEEMAVEVEKAAANLLECLKDPVKFIEPWQNLSFKKRNIMNRKAKSFSELIGNEVWNETKVCIERGMLNYKSLSDYVKSLNLGKE